MTAADMVIANELGLTPAQMAPVAPSVVALWSENEPAVRLFDALLTQWRMGPAGPVGLDYGVIETVAGYIRLTARQMRDAWQGLRVMEIEALAIFAERRKA